MFVTEACASAAMDAFEAGGGLYNQFKHFASVFILCSQKPARANWYCPPMSLPAVLCCEPEPWKTFLSFSRLHLGWPVGPSLHCRSKTLQKLRCPHARHWLLDVHCCLQRDVKSNLPFLQELTTEQTSLRAQVFGCLFTL